MLPQPGSDTAMRPTSLTNIVYATLLIGAGLALGWWLGDKSPAPDGTAPSVAQSPATPPEPSSNPGTRKQASRTPPAELPRTQEPQEATQDDLDRFRALLRAQDFQAALDLYQRIERRNPNRTPIYKEVLLETLETYLQSGQNQPLTRLVDAFLARHYDDIDVLLVLARQQTQSGYYLEATQSFQLAQSYALTQPAKQPKLNRALDRFVRAVDRRLTAQEDWPSLLHFYERLQQLDLAQPEHRLRQAELQLQWGDREQGRQMLERLTDQPALAAAATAVLERNRAPASRPPEPERPRLQDSIPLGLTGGQFHLPVRFAGGRDLNLIIDTGASLTALSRRSFEQLRRPDRFTFLGDQLFNTAGGPVQGRIYQVDQVRLGKQELRSVRVAVLDFELPDGLDGLLGMNFLRQFRFEVNQEQRRLYLQPREHSSP